jgi:hypothetical protein
MNIEGMPSISHAVSMIVGRLKSIKAAVPTTHGLGSRLAAKGRSSNLTENANAIKAETTMAVPVI